MLNDYIVELHHLDPMADDMLLVKVKAKNEAEAQANAISQLDSTDTPYSKRPGCRPRAFLVTNGRYRLCDQDDSTPQGRANLRRIAEDNIDPVLYSTPSPTVK